jgi:hypothetical protein
MSGGAIRERALVGSQLRQTEKRSDSVLSLAQPVKQDGYIRDGEMARWICEYVNM